MSLLRFEPVTSRVSGILLGVKGGLTTSPPPVSRLSRENVGASTSHNSMGLHGLLQGYLYLTFASRMQVGCVSR
jgi:hypothetical protein